MDKINVGADLHGDTVFIGFWVPCRVCVFGVHVFDIYAESYEGRHPHRILSQHKLRKKVKYPWGCLEI